jgi:hypothetical protein
MAHELPLNRLLLVVTNFQELRKVYSINSGASKLLTFEKSALSAGKKFHGARYDSFYKKIFLQTKTIIMWHTVAITCRRDLEYDEGYIENVKYSRHSVSIKPNIIL